MSTSTGLIKVSPILCGFFPFAIARLAMKDASVHTSSCFEKLLNDSLIVVGRLDRYSCLFRWKIKRNCFTIKITEIVGIRNTAHLRKR